MSEKAYPIVAVAENETTTQSRPDPLNMAECRSALEAIADSARTGSISTLPSAKLILRTCEKALAAPPRNCDKYATVEEAKKRFEVAYKDKVGFINFYKDTFAWLYADAKESEAAK